VTAEIRESIGQYSDNKPSDSDSTFLPRGTGHEFYRPVPEYHELRHREYRLPERAGRPEPIAPHFEGGTTYTLPRRLPSSAWTNQYGEQNPALPISRRVPTGPHSPTFSPLPQAARVRSPWHITCLSQRHCQYRGNIPDAIQMSLASEYQGQPRLSLNLSYTRQDLLSSQINGSYVATKLISGGPTFSNERNSPPPVER